MTNLDINKITLRTIQNELRKAGDKFTLGFLAGDRSGYRIWVTEVLIPKQRKTGYESSISAREGMKSLLTMMGNGLQCVGVAIYQPNLDLYLSATSVDMMKKLCELSDQPMACLVCNEKLKKVLWRMF